MMAVQGELEERVTVVGIVGLGLIGGSIGLALASNPDWRVIGYDVREDIPDRALKIGACTAKAESLDDIARNSDILVAAVPSSKISEVVLAAARSMRPGTTVRSEEPTSALQSPSVSSYAAF